MDSDRERFENLERRAADMIEAVTGTRMHHEEGEETVNVCKAILDIQQEAYDQRKLEGEQNEQTNTLREKERADAEKNRADTAETRADAEKSRADAAEQELHRLQEEIRRLRVQLAGGN